MTDPGDDPGRVRSYPEALSAWWTERAQREGIAPARVVEAAARLSDAFTVARPAVFDDYARDAATRLAYGWMFFPQSWVRARFPVAEAVDLLGWRFPRGRAARVVDVGAGQGGAGLGAAAWCLARGAVDGVDLVAVDRSRHALDDLEDLAHDGALGARAPAVSAVVRDVAAPGSAADLAAGADLVVASFALDEVAAGSAEAAAAWLRGLLPTRGLLVVVEPATREASLRLRAAAGRLVAGGLARAWGPAPSPAFGGGDGRHWPYESRRWTPPPTVARVNARLWRSLSEVTFSTVTLAAADPPAFPATPAALRVVSPVGRPKGLLAWAGAAADGTTYAYEVLRRHAKQARDRFEPIERGDVLVLSAFERAGQRVRLPSADSIATHYHPD